jgi:hypothetical protein
MAETRKYRVRLSRSVVSTASVTVEAKSQKEALFLAGRLGEEAIEWRDEAGDAQIDSVVVEGEAA